MVTLGSLHRVALLPTTFQYQLDQIIDRDVVTAVIAATSTGNHDAAKEFMKIAPDAGGLQQHASCGGLDANTGLPLLRDSGISTSKSNTGRAAAVLSAARELLCSHQPTVASDSRAEQGGPEATDKLRRFVENLVSINNFIM